jgi:hypothetical protein
MIIEIRKSAAISIIEEFNKSSILESKIGIVCNSMDINNRVSVFFISSGFGSPAKDKEKRKLQTLFSIIATLGALIFIE